MQISEMRPANNPKRYLTENGEPTDDFRLSRHFDPVMLYSVDTPTYNDYDTIGINVDKAAAHLFGGSALSSLGKGGVVIHGGPTAAKRMRDSGGIYINSQPYRELRYIPSVEDQERGYFTIGIGKPSNQGGRGFEMPIGLAERVTIKREDIEC